MIEVKLTNEILQYILEIEKSRYRIDEIALPPMTESRLRKNSKKKSSYASNKIEGNPLTEKQADEVLEQDERKHLLKPEQEIRNYYLALNFLEEQQRENALFSKELILETQKLVCKGASKEKIGFRGPMPPGVLFAVYDSESGRPDYIPPEYKDIPELIQELVTYVNTTEDHPLIVAAVVHYQLVTIHPFEDGNGRTARLLSGYIMDRNGFGFHGIGSLEEYFSYDVAEYYESIQMGLPALYYAGRDNPPHPEIWILYFLRMVRLYAEKICEISAGEGGREIEGGLSYLKEREREVLRAMLISGKPSFTPLELAKSLGNCTNKTVINRLAVLSQTGFAAPEMTGQRIRNYRISDFAKEHKAEILKAIGE